MTALGGVLCSAIALPVVAATGVLVRNTANKVTATSLSISTPLPQRSAIYDRNGHLITYVYGVDDGQATYKGIDRQPVNYNEISTNMLKAIVAIEDDRYWQHGAIDFQGTLRAVVNDAGGQPGSGRVHDRPAVREGRARPRDLG